jgi:hypothetical protein
VTTRAGVTTRDKINGVLRSPRTWRFIGRIGIVLALCLALNGYRLDAKAAERDAEYERRERVQDCEERVGTRSDINSAIVAASDEIAEYAELPPSEKAKVLSDIRHRVEDEFPSLPPDCQ